MVAATWRPVGLDLEAEVSASRAISIFVRAGRVTAAPTVALAILVLPDLVPFGVGFAIVLVSVLISVVVQDREDARDLAVHVKYAQQYVELTDSRWETLRQRHPWASAKSIGACQSRSFLHALARTAAAHRRWGCHSQRADSGQAGATGVFSFLFGSISAVLVTLAAWFRCALLACQ